METPGAPIGIDGGFADALAVESRPDFGRGGLRFRYASGGTGSVLNTGYIHDGKWHHIIWYQKGGLPGSEWGLFIDGKLLSKAKLPVRKKAMPIVRQQDFDGEMEDFQIFNYALSAAAAEELYETGRMDKVELQNDGSTTEP